MVLKPLEFSDCIADSPWFRQNLREHESALEEAYKNIKNIENQCRELISCTRKLSQAQRAFAKTLTDFKIETVGTNQTDDERVIATCLKEFGKLIRQVEEHRTRIVDEAEATYLEPLRKFRVEAIGRTLHDEKKKYERESSKFYSNLEKHLHLSTVRKNDFREADAQLDMQQRNFFQASLQYVAEIQSVQERMKFEFVETLSSFLYSWLSFYHVGHVIHEDFKPFLDGVQVRVQKTKESFHATQTEALGLKERIVQQHMKDGQGGSTANIKQGYLYMQEKSKIPKTIGRDVLKGTWTKYYCVYSKETRIFTMLPVNSTVKTDMKSALGLSVSFRLKECVRRASETIDKRFCFDVVADERADTMTFQALSEEDRRQWLDAMDGRQPIYAPASGAANNNQPTQLDEAGFDFVRACIACLEDKGVREQGLYRNCGVTSKVQKLMQLGLDKRKTSGAEKLNLKDEQEWETKTVSSAIKTFLRNLPEPLMTFDLHNFFINAAKMDDAEARVGHIHFYVHRLPEVHRSMLEIIVRHLRRVADHSSENLMTVGNLGVCFGPTLLRPKEETMAAIMDIKFCNVVVEVLIANCEKIFSTKPTYAVGPCPPKPDHKANEDEDSERNNGGGVTLRPRSEPRNASSASPKHRENIYDLVSTQSPSRLAPTTTHSAIASTSSPTTRTAPTGRVDSSDSLSSAVSAGSESPKGGVTPTARALSEVPATTRATKKLSTPYPPPYVPSLPGESRRVKTLYACVPDHPTELSFDPGQIITNVTESKEEGWLIGTLNGKTGLIPANYVESLP